MSAFRCLARPRRNRQCRKLHKAEDFGTAAIVSVAGGATDTLRGYTLASPALWAAIVRRMAVKHLLNPPEDQLRL
jgi:hypothetical protein